MITYGDVATLDFTVIMVLNDCCIVGQINFAFQPDLKAASEEIELVRLGLFPD